MGNEQSNTRTRNYKKVKITDIKRRTESGENWLCSWVYKFVDFEFDEYISYRNGSSKKLSFDVTIAVKREEGIGRKFFDQVAIGDYLEIDLDKVKENNQDYSFSFYDGVLKGIERINADNSFVEFLKVANEFLGTCAETRQRNAALAESARFQNQVLQFQTSLNMPPR